MSKKLVAGAISIAAIAAGMVVKLAGHRLSVAAAPAGPTREPVLVDDYDSSRFIASLTEAIKVPTVITDDGAYDSDAFDALHMTLARLFPLVHEHLQIETFNTHSLLFTWEGSSPKLAPIVLMGHQDVVPVEPGTEEAWVAEPFAGEVVGDRIYGRGSLDCKGQLIATLEAIEYLLENDKQPSRTVYVVSGHDEETGGRNGAGVISSELESRGVRPWFVVDEGGAVTDGLISAVEAPVALIGTAEKGYVDVTLAVEGQGGHSSMPPKDTAIVTLARAVAELERSPMKPRIEAIEPMLRSLADAMSGMSGIIAARPDRWRVLLEKALANDEQMDPLQRSTMVTTMFNAGVKSNVIPQLASANVNVRIIPGDTVDSVLAHIKAVVGPNVEVEISATQMREPSTPSATDSDGWMVLTGVIRDVFPGAVIAPWVLTGATDSRYFEPFSDDVYRFSPFVIDEEAMNGFHGTNEFVSVDGAKAAVSFFVQLISEAATPDG